MKLMDKIKDLFMDEVVDDDEIELEEEEKAEYKEPPKEELPKVMRETIAKEEKLKEEKLEKPKPRVEEFIREPVKEEVKPEPIPERPKKFTFPIDFDDEVEKATKREEPQVKKHTFDFDAEFRNNNFNNNGNINVLDLERETTKKTVELYPPKEELPKSKFKASPVISPVYGILDKNYTKEEVREKTDDNAIQRHSKKVDFETVRKKAFGNLADEIKDNMLCENCELYKEVKKISALKEDDLLYEMTVDEDKDVTIEKAYDNYEEFGVAYEPKPVKKKVVVPEEEEKKTSLDDIIKSNEALKEEEVTLEEPVAETEEEKEEPVIVTEPEVIPEEEEEVPSRQDKKKDAKVDDDFFDLIDSMYKERTDD